MLPSFSRTAACSSPEGVTSGGAVTNTAEIFDPVAGTWTSVTGGMVEARSGLTAALLHDGRVLIAGGNNGTLVSSTVEASIQRRAGSLLWGRCLRRARSTP